MNIGDRPAEDRPCFEVVNPTTGHAYRIWPNGRVEGFPMDAGYVVFNRIPQLIMAEQRADKT